MLKKAYEQAEIPYYQIQLTIGAVPSMAHPGRTSSTSSMVTPTTILRQIQTQSVELGLSSPELVEGLTIYLPIAIGINYFNCYGWSTATCAELAEVSGRVLILEGFALHFLFQKLLLK